MCELSIIIPTKNGTKFLRAAVQSVLSQCLPSTEILVIDDGSTDGSFETIKDLPVTLVRSETSRGIAASYNRALSLARGEFVAFLDHDDLAVPEGLSRALGYLKANPEFSVVRGEVADIIDGENRVLGRFEDVFHPVTASTGPVNFTDLVNPNFQPGVFLCALWLHVFRRRVFEEVGRFDETLKVAHDVDYLIRVLKLFSIFLISVPLVRYRMHAANTSGKIEAGRFKAHPRTIAETILVGWSHGIESLSGKLKLPASGI